MTHKFTEQMAVATISKRFFQDRLDLVNFVRALG